MIDLGRKKWMFWDEHLIDTDKTTAYRKVNQPTHIDCCFSFDVGAELDTISVPCIVKDDKGYKMYYHPWDFGANITLAVIESVDGINWTRPKLDDGSNIVMNNVPVSFFVFFDTNPACPTDEKYKAIGVAHMKPPQKSGLWCYTSPDGYHFEPSHLITQYGRFDSLNTVHWENGRYACYFRDFHNTTIPGNINGTEAPEKLSGLTNEQWHSGIRDVRVMFSEDFKNWTKPELIKFSDGLDYALYTNNVIPYERAPHISIGFPTRYFEKTEWTQNEKQIGSSAIRKKAIENTEKRSGLAITDCIFMFSYDGMNWNRYNEAFMTPGYEHEHNWVYGDCYPAYGMIDSGKETYYMYTCDWHRSQGEPKPLNRYAIRKDGFAYFYADGEEKVIVTKPLTFDGDNLHINFSGSAFGYIFVDILDENGNPLTDKISYEIYGDNIDRKVCFADNTDFSMYRGKTVRLRFKMRDSKIYSMWFE